MFGSRMIKPDLNRARLVKKKKTMRANKSRCKGMLNEAVPKSTAVGQKECRRAREKRRRGQDFLCVWERFQKGNTGSHIPPRQNEMIHLYLLMVFSFITRKNIPLNQVTLSTPKPYFNMSVMDRSVYGRENTGKTPKF